MSNQKYAFVKNNLVFDILIFDSPSQELLDIFKTEKNADSVILATEKTSIGGEYDGTNFWTIKPFPTWVKDTDTNSWIPPIPFPQDGKFYFWNETEQNWIEPSLEEDIIE